jgi:hypothetical protein
MIAAREGLKEDLRYVLAWLNSDMVNHWYRVKGSRSGHRILYTQAYVAKVPLLLIDRGNETQVSLHNKIVSEVQRILDGQEPQEPQANIEHLIQEIMASKADIGRSGDPDPTTPQILVDIVEFLVKKKVEISKAVEGEGRGGSLNDEGSIKKALMEEPKFKGRISSEMARKAGDIIVLDYDGKTEYWVNIKTSLGGQDNSTSRVGFVYALTDIKIEDLPAKLTLREMEQLVENHKANIPFKDYWFLCVDKKDSTKVFVRGAKQIKNWYENPNPANFLQINWKKEKNSSPVNRTWEEAYDTLIGGYQRCIRRFLENIPEKWREDIGFYLKNQESGTPSLTFTEMSKEEQMKMKTRDEDAQQAMYEDQNPNDDDPEFSR